MQNTVTWDGWMDGWTEMTKSMPNQMEQEKRRSDRRMRAYDGGGGDFYERAWAGSTVWDDVACAAHAMHP